MEIKRDLSEKVKTELIEAISRKISKLECPMCHTNNFTLSSGYSNIPIQFDLNGIVIGGPSMPSIAIICNNCGFISNHALGVLGLLPKNEEEKENTNS